MADFGLEGAEEVLRKLRKLPERIGRNAMRRSMRKGANVVRDAARKNARRIDDPQTAEMISKNIVTQGVKKRTEDRVGGPMMRVGVLGGSRDMTKYGEFKGAGSGNPGGDTWYWRLVEFGTSHSAAQPFMRPALENNAESAAQTIMSDMQAQLDKELAKL